MSVSIQYSGGSWFSGRSVRQLAFGYKLNTASFDTAAGRVVQVLSAQVTELTVTGQATSFSEYMGLVKFVRNLMLWQANNHGNARLTAGGYVLDVTARGVTLQEQLTQATYPWKVTFDIDQDVNGVVTTDAMGSVFDGVAKNIGWTAGKQGFHGGDGTKPSVMTAGTSEATSSGVSGADLAGAALGLGASVVFGNVRAYAG